MQPFYTTRGASRAPFLLIRGEAATAPFEPVEPFEPSEPFPSQPFYTTCRRQAATTFGPEGRQPFLYNPSTQPAAKPRPFFIKLAASAATTTLGAKGPVKLKNPPAHRAGQS